MNIQENFSLKDYNTFAIDAKSRYFVEYDTQDELLDLIQKGFLADNQFLSIGSGSNLLFVADYEGVVLHSQIKTIEIVDETAEHVFIQTGAGIVWDDFVSYCVDHDYYGVENLSLIPGEIGALPVQNIGAYGVEAKDVVYSVEGVEIASGNTRTLSNADCQFGYRDSVFKHAYAGKMIVTHVVFKLSKTADYKLDYGSVKEELAKYEEVNLKSIRSTIIAIRQSKLPDPKKQGNAGSFFKNPVVDKAVFDVMIAKYPQMPFYEVSETKMKIPAGWLIEQAGWKGKSHGNAAVHDKQALVIVNKGGATGKEIIELANLISQSVLAQFGMSIHPEVILV